MEQDPYASLEARITMPQKQKLSLRTTIFTPISNDKNNQGYELTESLLHKTNSLLEELNQTFQVYKNPKDFEFIFPQSMFQSVPENETNRIRYERKIINQQENTFKNRLSQQQLKEIEETGQFKVRSNVEYITLPYVWKINEALFWGREKIKKQWMQSLAAIYGFFWKANQLIRTQIPNQLDVLKSLPYSLFKLFFGKKSTQTVVSVDYSRQLFKDFWLKVVRQLYEDKEEWFNAVWNYLFVYFDPAIAKPIKDTEDQDERNQLERKRTLMRTKYEAEKEVSFGKIETIYKIESAFNQEWAKRKKQLILEISEQVNNANISFDNRAESEDELLLQERGAQLNETDEQILQQLAGKRLSLYLEHFRSELPKADIPLSVVNGIILILRLFTVIQIRYERVERQKQQRRRVVEDKIRKHFPIKSLYYGFFIELVDRQMQEIEKGLEQEMYEGLFSDAQFAKFLNKNQFQAYREFLKLKSNWDSLLLAKKMQIPEYHAPTRVFYSNYLLLPPYQILKEGQYYSLKKVSDDLTVDTSQNFWKLRLYWMRLKTWTINSLVFLSFSVWKGPFGVRALWGSQDYDSEMQINSTTGKVYYETHRTVLGTFYTVIEGIQKSRQHFEQTPDLGLLGKNVSRIFNYIECYIFRFLLVGVLLVLIGFPILIIAASTLTLLLVFTFWAWMPVVLVLTYLFNIFIKQFETALVEYGFLARSFPLLRIFLRSIFSIVIIIGIILNLLVIAPLRAAFWLTVASVSNIFRRLLDSIMMLVFRKLGRTPSRDTFVAKKISGPGMSKDFYMSINEEDVYILVRANLQQKLMYKMNSLITQKIDKHGSIFSRTMSKILEPFGAHYSKTNFVLQNQHQLVSNYQKQFQQYMRRYPHNPVNVRFTQEEIDCYFPNTVSIVRHFVDKNKISGWIFEENELYEGMYDDLTRTIWMEVFQCGEEIFEPLQKLDARFKLEDQYRNDDVFSRKMKMGVGSVMKALEGEVKFQHHHKRLTPFKHSLLSREYPTVNSSSVFDVWRRNSVDNSVYLELGDLRTLFVPNLNIRETVEVDRELRIQSIRRQKFIIDL